MYEEKALSLLADIKTRLTELEQLVSAFEQSVTEVVRVRNEAEQGGNAELEAYGDSGEALPAGSTILGGHYRLVHLLHQRPRVNLYVGQRLSRQENTERQPEKDEPLVAIRELMLTGLSLQVRAQIEQAAFEEFVSQMSGAGDRVRIEGERHYLVMQLQGARGERRARAVTLADLLLSQRQWPSWLDTETALGWGVQLCRIVARLHRLGAVLGDLDPATVLVNKEGAADWAPVLLVSWPPALQYWPASLQCPSPAELHTRIFPIVIHTTGNAFAAPETFHGGWDERSDVYSLGAILYLLLTCYAPAAAIRRQQAAQKYVQGEQTGKRKGEISDTALIEGMALIPPHLFNARISLSLEYVLLRALSLDPDKRYPSVFALVEALEAIDLKKENTERKNTLLLRG